MILINTVIPFVSRAAAAVLALFSIWLTYDFLSAQDFALLNYILFILAMGSALSSPINRLFWAENSRQNFIVAAYSTCAISGFLAVILLTLYGFANSFGLKSFILTCSFSVAYIIYKVTERYTYGQILFDRSLNAALAVPALFALLEFLFVAFQYQTGWPSLSARLLGPVLLASVMVIAIPAFRPYLLILIQNLRQLPKSLLIMKEQNFSAKGGKMLFLTIATTTGIMVDRLILGYFPIRNDAASADYLLVLSYAIAIQTFLNLLIDLGRKYIYQNMAWVQGGRSFTRKVFAGIIPLVLSLILVFPILKYLSIIPASVSIYVWGILILRTITSFIINFSYTDSIQAGRISDAIIPVMVLIIISLAFLCMLILGVNERMIFVLCGISLGMLILIVITSFYRRVPADLT